MLTLVWKILEGEHRESAGLAEDCVLALETQASDDRSQDADGSVRCARITEHVTDAEVFLFKPARIRLGIQKSTDGYYGDQNRVSGSCRWNPPVRQQSRNRSAAHRRSRPVTCAAGPGPVGTAPWHDHTLMFELRPYQREALNALETYWRAGGGNPSLSLATATGKSMLIAWLIRDLLARYPKLRILILVHIQELIEQNVQHLLALWPEAPLGINCAAFGRREWEQQIIFASIQSVFRSPERLGRRDLILIDEVHLVPHAGDGMYRSLLETLRESVPALRVCGLTGDAVSARQRPAGRGRRQDLRRGRLRLRHRRENP